MFFFPPALLSLFEEWRTTAMAVVPGLANTGLESFTEVGSHPWALPMEVGFRYASTQALGSDNAIWAMIEFRKVDVTEGFARADAVVNAFLATAGRERPATLASQAKACQAFAQGLKHMFTSAQAGPWS